MTRRSRSWGAALIGLALLALPGGCVRVGFDHSRDGAVVETSDGTDADRTDVLQREDSRVTSSGNPTCSAPVVVDLSDLTTTKRSVWLDFSGADRNFDGCFAQLGPARSDMVVKVINATGKVKISCGGGGEVVLTVKPGAGCPPSVNACFYGKCTSGNYLTLTLTGTSYYVIGRSVSAGPLQLRFERAP
jgi:hypothetical protein